MPIHTLNTVPPLVHVGLAVVASFAALGLGRAPSSRNGLIDTGASMTAIAPALVLALGPQRVGQQPFIRPDQTLVRRPTYAIRLCFEPDVGDAPWAARAHWFDVVAVAAILASPGVQVLIGQDLLAKLVLSWDGPGRRLLVMYGSRGPIGS